MASQNKYLDLIDSEPSAEPIADQPKKKPRSANPYMDIVDETPEPSSQQPEQDFNFGQVLLENTPAGMIAGRQAIRTNQREPINERQWGMIKKRGRGFNQMIMKAAKSKGLVSQEDYDQYTKSALDKQEKFEKEFLEKYGDSEFWDQIDFETDIGTSLMIPGAFGKSRVARVLFGSLVGGMENASRLEEDESEITGNFTTGALWGLGASGVVELLDSLRPTQMAKRAYEGYKDADKKVRGWAGKNKILSKPGILNEGEKAQTLIGQHLTASEVTQDPFLQALEQMVRADPTTEAKARLLSNKQLAKAFRWFKGKANQADPTSSSFATRMEADFDDAFGQLTKVRKWVANKNFDAAFKANNGAKHISTKGIKTALTEEIEKLSQSGVGIGKQKTKLKQLIELRGSLDDKITSKNAQALYESWSPGTGIESKVFKELDTAAEKRILKRLTGQLDNAVDASGDKLLIKARDNYRINSAPITELRDSGVGKLFGKGNPTPEEIVDTFKNMGKTDIQSSIKVLKRKDPEIVNRLKAFKINQALDNARAIKDPSAPQISLPDFMDAMSPKNDKSLEVIFNARERSDILKGVNYLNRVNKSINKMTSTQQLEPGALANRTILSKMIGRFLGARGFGDLLFTPGGLERLKTAAQAPNLNALSAAITDLVEYDAGGKIMEEANNRIEGLINE